MSIKLFQNLIYQIKEVIDREFGIMDESGLILASSDDAKAGQIHPAAKQVMQAKDAVLVLDGIACQKVYIRGKMEFIVYIDGNSDECMKYLSLISINAANIKSFNDEKYDKGTFIKNIILDNVLPGDIPLKSKELHLQYNSYRVVFLIKTETTKDIYAHDIIQGLFPGKVKDFVIVLDDENTVLVKELRSNDDTREIEKTANIIVDTLGTELMVKAYVGIGTVVDNIRDLGRSFKEAQMAFVVGNIFDEDKSIVNYNRLGIGRLIYQLPTTLCKLFLQEVFKDGSYDSLDAETLLTIQKFFENNLNVSETSRQLYVHRNTLVYRLDKIRKITGLDLTNFDDAVTFKVAMLVKRYLDKSEKML